MTRPGKIPHYVLTSHKSEQGRDCAYCHSSETQGRGFRCKLGLPMVAESCPSYRDSRKPSSLPPGYTENP